MKKTITVIICILIYSVTYAIGSSGKEIGHQIINSISDASAPDISKTDSLIFVDQKNIVEKVAHEVFTNYYDSIQSFKKNFGSISVMNYIDDYIKRQNDSIETRISDKSYIHRFATTEKTWLDTDFSEMAALLKVRTLDRIKEISEDVDRTVLNVLNTITNDKELLLEKEVRNEIKE